MKKLLFSMLALAAMSMSAANAQTPTVLKANGFVAGNQNVLLVPGPTVPFNDVFVGEPVTLPPRIKGQGPQLAPTRVLINGVEVNPATAGVYLAPSPNANYLRVWWTPALLPADAQGPGFGRADLEGFYGEDGSYLAQFYVPKMASGAYVTGYPLVAFGTLELRTAVLKTEQWKTFVAARDKAKTDAEAKDKKKDEKKDEKKDKKDEGDDKKPDADAPKPDGDMPPAEEKK